MIPASLAQRYQVLPLRKDGNILRLAMADPTNFYAIDDIRMATGIDVEPVIAAEKEIIQAIDRAYGVREAVEKAANKIRQEEVQTTEFQATEDAPVVSIVKSLINQAIKERASDIHIEPQDKTVRVRFRIDGVLREIASFPCHTHAAIVSRVKIMGEMDISERRIPQDGRIQVSYAGAEIDIRVSTLPTILGEKVVMRILNKSAAVLDINGLGFSDETLTRYKKLYQQSYGMLLVTGPTGSGKTTTLYSTLTAINSPGKNVITVEDPVEYRLDGINQVQVNHKAGLTFASGLRSILRQDPNIVMVGEIRDSETVDIAVRAALTGHLVLSTLHTNDACGTVTRLIEMGIEPFLVSSSILGILAQRLVRLICPECKQKYVPEQESPERTFLGVSPAEEIFLYHGAGCLHCGQTGYLGRVGIHEILPLSADIRELINRRASAGEISEVAIREGMRTMRDDGVRKALAGLTTVSEVMRVAYSGV
jgi:type IV pilus assembly protein PilB